MSVDTFNRRRAAGTCYGCEARAVIGGHCLACYRELRARETPKTSTRKCCQRCGALGHNRRGCAALAAAGAA